MIHPETLLHGPRGRRLLLAFALASERLTVSDNPDYLLHRTVADAAYFLDPGRGRSRVMVSPDNGDTARPEATPDDVASLLTDVQLVEVTDKSLRDALVESVDRAMYWQEPDGEDALAATSPVHRALERVAEYIASSPLTAWWHAEPDLQDQWFVQFRHPDGGFPEVITLENLVDWRAQQMAAENRALRERPSDPTAKFSANWWSIPPMSWWHSMRSLDDGTPAGLWLAEDAGPPKQAQVRHLRVPAGSRIYEIDGADAWAELCRMYPLEQSAQKRHDWYRTTGRVGRWVMPDWSQVAKVYDGVHLTVAGYLAAAGIAIPVDEDVASVIAGWNPDETWWFVDRIEAGQPVTWERDTHIHDSDWMQSP